MTEKNLTGAKIYVKDGIGLDAALGILRIQEGIGAATSDDTREDTITRAEVQGMIDAATATEKARLWNIQCFYAKREDLQVSVTAFASDAFKLALAQTLGDALDAPLTVGETPKAPWLRVHPATNLVSQEVEVLGAGELILQRLDAILELLNPVVIHSSPSVDAPNGTV